jgi:hypothetical protein
MYIAVSNSIGSSSNGGAPLPPPATEYYQVKDCINDDYYFYSQNYPIGTFVVDDMVTFEISGQPRYGRILEVLDGVGGADAITATGANQEGYCNLSDVHFEPEVYLDGYNIFLNLVGYNNGPNSLIDEGPNALTYHYSFTIECNTTTSFQIVNASGSIPIEGYGLGVGGFSLGNFLIYSIASPEPIVSINVTYTATSPEFGSTIGYHKFPYCIDTYFLRTNDGTTFICTTPNDC